MTLAAPNKAVIARRTFSLADQRAFAAVSGDWNPLHVDPLAARRRWFGAPVVHGIHLVVWALEQWLPTQPLATLRIESLRARFLRPAFLDRDVVLSTSGGARTPLLSITSDGELLDLAIVVEADRGGGATLVLGDAWPTAMPPDEVTFDRVDQMRGQLALTLDVSRSQFPTCIARLGTVAVAQLLATTRLVGMHCPGARSLYAGLTLSARDGDPSAVLRYAVNTAKPAYSTVTIDVSGPTLAGTLDTFLQPAPATCTMADAIAVIEPRSRVDERPIVIGGSRGLGEAFAKALAAAGADVTLTYRHGADDARRVVDDIHAAGLRATACALDIHAPHELATRWPHAHTPTHLYYCATPNIFGGGMMADKRATSLRTADLDAFSACYVTGLYATVVAALALGAPHLVVWTPSTSMLDAKSGGLEYCLAKAAMEELCRQLPALLPVTVHAPRLGRIDTDQTASLIRLSSESALATAIAQLRAIAR